MRHLALALALPLLVSPGAVVAGQRADAVAQEVRRVMDDEQLPSVAVAIARNGRIIWEEGIGWADAERQIAATAHTPYSLASISKPFTATAVMKLVESGHLALHRPANDYLGDAKVRGRDAGRATVGRMLSHTSGLPSFYRAVGKDAPLSMDEVIAGYALLSAPPGRRYTYSNLGYGILDQIIARVSGLPFEDFMRREVFGPLGLESASVPFRPPAGAAVRHGPDGAALPFYDLGHRGASSVFASAHDLARFGMFHLKERLDDGAPLLGSRSIDRMQRIDTPGSRTEGYGLGWRIEEASPGFRHVGHTGGMPGVTTVLSLFPSERVVIVVLANKRSDAVVRLADRIAQIVMPRYAWEVRRGRPNGE
jgi:CubicO group peptidase (beta-lactamase class C family)